MDWRMIFGVLARAAWSATKKAAGLAWMCARVWAAFWVARLTVPEFFYGRGREIVLTEDVAVMMVGVVLALGEGAEGIDPSEALRAH